MKTVLITGASRGIGRACAERFAEAGYKVAIHYRVQEAAARQLAQQLGRRVPTLAVQADVTDRQQVEDMVRAVRRRLGPVDVLVNNAGIAQQKPFAALSEEDWNGMMAVHVTGAFHTCQAVLSGMLERGGGAIVNVSSMWGQVGASCEVHYSAAKAALLGMTRALAKELGPSHIRVNAVTPGVIDTDMNAALTREDWEELRLQTPLEAIGRAEEVAQAVLYLASDAASYVTGQVLGVNGGLVL